MTQQGIYNESKPVWWYVREGKLPDAPKQVQVILSDLCNQDCNFCAYRMSGYTSNELFVGTSERAAYGHDNPRRWMPTDRALELVYEMYAAGVLALQFTGGGEPTVHPDHEVIMHNALEFGFRCALVSNGVRWSDTLHKLLPRFDWVRVSIDAARKESYARTRRTSPASWARVWRNVTRLVDSIEDERSACMLGLGFVVTPESWREIVSFAKLASEFGVHNVRYTAMFSTENEQPYMDIYDSVVTQIREARMLYQRDTFRVYDNFGARYDDLKQRAPDYPTCAYQHYTSYVGGDMQVYRCCVLAYNRRGKVRGGDLTTRSFAEFWRSNERKEDMACLDARKCPRCQFNAKNRALAYVMGNTESDVVSRHIEWP